jgi:hypothetical protein
MTDNQDAEVVKEQETRTMKRTTAKITVEVSDDGDLDQDERIELAIALLEQGMNTDFASWDDQYQHPIPTYRGRVL